MGGERFTMHMVEIVYCIHGLWITPDNPVFRDRTAEDLLIARITLRKEESCSGDLLIGL
jgi:hypothetical protein